MWFQCRCFLDSICHLKDNHFTLVVNGFGQSCEFLYHDHEKELSFKKQLGHNDIDIIFSPITYSEHPPVRWFIEPKSDLCVFVDSDVLLCSINQEEIKNIKQFDISGMIAHNNPAGIQDWNEIFETFGISNRSLNYLTTDDKQPCPYYVNYGVLFVNSRSIPIIRERLKENLLKLNRSRFRDNHFVGQIALAITLADIQLNKNCLSIRHNYSDFPNYDHLDNERNNIRFFHYLTTKHTFASLANMSQYRVTFSGRKLDLLYKVIERKLLHKCNLYL